VSLLPRIFRKKHKHTMLWSCGGGISVDEGGDDQARVDDLSFHTTTHRAYVHITPQVEEIVHKSGVKEGMVLVSAMHITAGVYVNDNESGLIEDIGQWLEHLAPFRKDYKHHDTGEDNGDSHLKALLIHHEVIVPITGGKLDLGTWQRVFMPNLMGSGTNG
jgi:secondary thiamine-phosphate synthase enzyme